MLRSGTHVSLAPSMKALRPAAKGADRVLDTFQDPRRPQVGTKDEFCANQNTPSNNNSQNTVSHRAGGKNTKNSKLMTKHGKVKQSNLC